MHVNRKWPSCTSGQQFVPTFLAVRFGKSKDTQQDKFDSVKEYRNIPKISPEAYFFQRAFLRGLFLQGLIFEGAYLRREICVSKSIGLALQLEVNLPLLLCFTLYLRGIFQVQAPGGLYLKGRFNGGFFALPVWGLILGGAYFRNFTVLKGDRPHFRLTYVRCPETSFP